MSDLPPLSPELQSMLTHEREIPPEGLELRRAKRRVWQGVALAVGTAIPIAAAGSAAAATSAAKSSAATSSAANAAGSLASGAATSAAATSTVATSSAVAGASVIKIAVAVGLAAFVAGGVTGSAVTQAWLAPPEQAPLNASPTSGDSTQLAPATASPTAPQVVPPRGLDIDSLPSADPDAPTPNKPIPPDLLTRERQLLDVARAALSAGNPSEALSALGRHQSQFPKGQLREERQALLVSALRAAGRTEEAENTAKTFQNDFPDSLFEPSLEPKEHPSP